jgi:hypothetical protein
VNPPNWQEAAAGLDTHRSAVLLRIVVMIVGVLYVATMMMSSSHDYRSGVFGLVIGAGELCATAMALIGVVRFAGKAPSRARSMASFASFALIAVIVAEIYALWIGWRLLELSSAMQRGNPFDMAPSRDLLEHLERLPYINIGAGIAGMLAILTVLGSLTSIGHALSDDNLIRRSRRMSIAVVILGVGYGLILNWAVEAPHTHGYVVLAAIGAIAVFGLGVLFAYIGVLTMASDAMRSGAVAIPVARAR